MVRTCPRGWPGPEEPLHRCQGKYQRQAREEGPTYIKFEHVENAKQR